MSRTWVLVRGTIRSSGRVQRPLLALVMAFIAVMLTLSGIVGAGLVKYSESIQGQSALSLIRLSGTGASARTPITDATLRKARATPGVTNAYPWVQVDLSLADETTWPNRDVNPGALWGTPAIPGMTPKAVEGSIPKSEIGPDEIALPRTVPGGTLSGIVGKTIQMEYTKVVSAGNGEPAKRSFRVIAILDNSTPGVAGPNPSYLNLKPCGNYRSTLAHGIAASSMTRPMSACVQAEKCPRCNGRCPRLGSPSTAPPPSSVR